MIDKLSSMSLAHFRRAQTGEGGPSFASALREIQAGRKRSHWIWYVLPQLAGLGHSAMAQRYGIADLAEVSVIGLLQLILDDDPPSRQCVDRNDVSRERTYRDLCGIQNEADSWHL